MAKLSILAGATSQSLNIFIQNSSVTTGAGLTGLVFNTSGLLAYYAFTGANGGSNVIALATLSTPTSAYSSGGFKEIDSTNMPGLYRLDIPNAAIAGSKGRSVCVMLTGATNMAPVVLEIELTAVDNQSTAFGLSLAKTTNITGFNDIAASAIVSSGAITTSSGAVSTVTTVTNQLTAAAIATGVWQDSTSGDFTTASSIGKCLYIANIVPGGTGGHFIAGTNAATTITTGLTTTFTGNLTGSVGSVTGSVGSVTSAVAITSNRKKASTATFEFLMQDSTTGAPKTGLTVTMTISKDGGTSAGTTNAVTEIGLGQYQIVLTGTEMTANNIFLQATATGALTFNLAVQTQP